MNSKYHTICLFLAILMCFTLFSGCTPQEEEQSSSPSASASQSIDEILMEKTEEFEEDDPNKLTVYLSDTLGMMTNVVLGVAPKKGIPHIRYFKCQNI